MIMTMTIIIIIYLARNKKYCNKKVLSEAPVNFYFHFSIVCCAIGNFYAILGEITVIMLLENGTLSAMLNDLLSKMVSEESIGHNETKALRKTSQEQCIITSKRSINNNNNFW